MVFSEERQRLLCQLNVDVLRHLPRQFDADDDELTVHRAGRHLLEATIHLTRFHLLLINNVVVRHLEIDTKRLLYFVLQLLGLYSRRFLLSARQFFCFFLFR